ncbi:MAG: carbohydrate ABC transporter permease [Chloroflexi bacterium]|nr:carbohydrate ABC transporter permease [Chloroflexota bacterium]MDL1885209.1 carbohydrate ABC transporter permease [Anaerolineae bacterium CFX8]
MNVQAAEQPPAYTDLSVPLKIVTYLILAMGAVVMVMPFAWMASTACKPPAELSTLPIRWIPQNPACIENLNRLYRTSPNFSRYMLNSAIMTVGRTLGQLVTCSLAAYGFARYAFPGRNVIFALCLGLLMVPFQAILIPEYLLLRQLGWLNSFAALIVPGTFSAFAMFLLRQAFLQIPLELEESAMIDGANPLQILRHITLPLSGPALAAFAVITVQAAWNDFLFPLVAANTPDTRVVTIGISLLQGERSTPWNLLMMGSFLATVPMLALFVMLQRYFIEGVAMSGIKG